MPCGITVTKDTTPLEINSPALLEWWNCQDGDLTSWREPWVLSLSVKFPAARYHSAYHRVNTLSGPLWQRHIASEGFYLNMGRFSLTIDASTEQQFPDPTIAGYFYAPVYGRKVTLSVTNAAAGGSLTKSTYISTKDSTGKTDCWVILDIKYKPSTGILSIYGNGVFLLDAPIPTTDPGKLILSQVHLAPTPISDPIGEIHLSSTWPNDGVTPPIYTEVAHTAIGYPNSFVSYSPTLGFLDINRGFTNLPTHTEVMDPVACAYIGGPLLSLTGQTVGMLTYPKGTTFSIAGVSDNPDNGSCEVWWDTAHHGSILLKTAIMTGGQLNTQLVSNTADFGFLRIVNKTFSMGAGAPYLIKNPLPLVVV